MPLSEINEIPDEVSTLTDDAYIVADNDMDGTPTTVKILWSNIKAMLALLYTPISERVTNGNAHNHLGGDGGTIAHTSLDAVSTDDHHAKTVVADDIHAATGKTTIVDADEIGIADSAATWIIKKVTASNLGVYLRGIFPKRHVSKTTAPTANDDFSSGYFVGDRWIDETNDKEYVCLDSTNTAAVWTETTGAGAAGMSSQNDTVTTGNITLVEHTIHNQTIAGLTANRQNIFPVPTAIGKEITINTKDGDADYVMIPIGAATVTLNGGSAATADDEYRQFIAKESTTWVSTSLTNWQLKIDGRISCLSYVRKSTAQTITNNLWTKILVNANDIDRGDINDVVTNYRVTLKRPGNYDFAGIFQITGIDDGDRYLTGIYVNGTSYYGLGAYAGGGTNAGAGFPTGVVPRPCIVGDYIELWGYHLEGADQDTNTAAGGQPWLYVKEVF